METKHLNYFKVENFKRFDSLEVSDIGQFNLIVGDNNVGKTSLLEALLFDENYEQFIRNIWFVLENYRSIVIRDAQQLNFIDYYLNLKNSSIIYSYSFSQYSEINLLKINKKTILELVNSAKNNSIYPTLYNSHNSSGGSKHFLEFVLNGNERILDPLYFKNGEYSSPPEINHVPYLSFHSFYSNDLLINFSSLSINPAKKKSFLDELKYFIPNLESVELNNALIPFQQVIAIGEKGKDLIPLSQYGDGTVKLFRYLLEIETCEGQRLMIDEIDAGIHYSRMKEFLKKVLQSAKNKNVQIFATTHSKECLQCYTEALLELGYEKDGRIIKIADTKVGIKAYTYNFEQFENSLYAYSEIR